FLARLYPGLRGVAVALVVLVCCGRVAFGAHYPSDVLAGAAVGWGIGSAAFRGRWGVRAVNAVAGDRRRAEPREGSAGEPETDADAGRDGGQAAETGVCLDPPRAARAWRGGRAVECAGFEIRLGLRVHGGSNPPLSVQRPRGCGALFLLWVSP